MDEGVLPDTTGNSAKPDAVTHDLSYVEQDLKQPPLREDKKKRVKKVVKKRKLQVTEMNCQGSDNLMSTAQPIKSPEEIFKKNPLIMHSNTPKFLKEESTSEILPEVEEAEHHEKALSRPSAQNDLLKGGEGELPSHQQ